MLIGGCKIVKFTSYDPSNKQHWVDALKTGKYNIGRTPFTKVGHARVYLKRKKGHSDALKISRIFYVVLLNDEADEFIEQIKRKVGIK